MRIRFTWDPDKAASNLSKHRVDFKIALRFFVDPFAITEQDRFAGGEYRWHTLGLVDDALFLLVAHTVSDANGMEVIRIISTRCATSRERRLYERNRVRA